MRVVWLNKRKRWLQRGGIGFLGLGIFTVLIGGYVFHWGWTGFNKTLWDWMQLLIIPAMIAEVVSLYNRQDRHREREEARQIAEAELQAAERRAQAEQQLAEQRTMTERFLAQWRLEQDIKLKEAYQREALLQAYLDRMSVLLLDRELRSSDPEQEVRHVARAFTLTALQRLDVERQTDVFWFLYESGLLGSHKTERIVDVSDANWSDLQLDGVRLEQIDLHDVDLSRASLREADLRGANLEGITLCQADLQGATLTGSNLCRADLRSANLKGANLLSARLNNADLTRADLTGADLTHANLRGALLPQASLTQARLCNSTLLDADLTRANLTQADLQGATYTEDQLAAAFGSRRRVR